MTTIKMTTGTRAVELRTSVSTLTTSATATRVASQSCQVTGRQPKPTRRRRNQGLPIRRFVSLDDLNSATTLWPNSGARPVSPGCWSLAS
jgi:hypothetical protein